MHVKDRAFRSKVCRTFRYCCFRGFQIDAKELWNSGTLATGFIFVFLAKTWKSRNETEKKRTKTWFDKHGDFLTLADVYSSLGAAVWVARSTMLNGITLADVAAGEDGNRQVWSSCGPSPIQHIGRYTVCRSRLRRSALISTGRNF